jgi:predicted RNase H-like HicB family nuclease
VQEVDSATSYSTTVAGKQYSGSVQESNGEYTASVSSLSGASATGSSIQAAENNLNNRIDEIV